MGKKWKIVYYKTEQGTSPVFDFIGALELKARTKVANALDLLKEYGTKIGLPHAKKLSGSRLWELRILGSDSIKIFFFVFSFESRGAEESFYQQLPHKKFLYCHFLVFLTPKAGNLIAS